MTERLAAGLLGDAQQPQVHHCGQLYKCQQEVHLMPCSSCRWMVLTCLIGSIRKPGCSQSHWCCTSTVMALCFDCLQCSRHGVGDSTEGVLQIGSVKGMYLSIQSYHYEARAAFQAQHSAVEAERMQV